MTYKQLIEEKDKRIKEIIVEKDKRIEEKDQRIKDKIQEHESVLHMLKHERDTAQGKISSRVLLERCAADLATYFKWTSGPTATLNKLFAENKDEDFTEYLKALAKDNNIPLAKLQKSGADLYSALCKYLHVESTYDTNKSVSTEGFGGDSEYALLLLWLCRATGRDARMYANGLDISSNFKIPSPKKLFSFPPTPTTTIPKDLTESEKEGGGEEVKK